MTPSQLTPGQWILRALIAAMPAVAVLCTIGAGEAAPVWFVAVVVILGIGFAAFPESAVGVAVIALVLAWWGLGLRDGLDFWALPAAAALLTAHVAAVIAAYGPSDVGLDPAVARLWAFRALTVLLTAPVLFAAAAWFRDAPEPSGMWVTGLSAAFLATMAASLVFSRTRGT